LSDPFSLSIVVPVWMEASGVVETLGALQPLRAAGHEVIVVDAGSTDAQPDWQARLRIGWFSQKRAGARR